MKNNYIFYKIVANIIKFSGNIWFGGKCKGKYNIPKKGACILAGNHLSDFDAYMLYKGTNRPIHFLGKKELFDGKFGWFFNAMHLIPVDRKNKNPKAINKSIELLNDGKIIGIFPEGTYHKNDLLLPFKPGVINFAEKTGAPIIPFALYGQWHFRSKPKIVFGKPIYINRVKSNNKVKYLENKIRKMLIDLNENKTSI